MTAKQDLVAHLEQMHGEHVHKGTHQQLALRHKGQHDSKHLPHTHTIADMTTGNCWFPMRIFLSPPKNPSASRNQDRNWVLNIANMTKGMGWRWEIPGTSAGFPEEAKVAANKLLGYEANWVAVGWGFQHEEKVNV